jgi:type I restriction enzyme S subunit
MTRWTQKYLGEIADLCLGKMLDEQKNKGDLLPYLANVNVRWGEFDFDGLREMRFLETEWERYGLKYGDIVMCEGGEPGRCAIWKETVPGMMIQKALHRIRPINEIDHRYLFYFFLHTGTQGGFAPLFTGATIKHLPKQSLEKLEVRYPPLEQQKLVANVLSSYDDLIENNRRRMALLEDSARQLYREWFVRLRFPGHEHTPIVDGMPQGWTSGLINDLVDVQSGYAFKTGTYESSGDFGLVTIKNVQDGFFDTECNSFIVEPPKQMPNHCHLKTADILLSLTGNIGRICHVIGDSYLLNQRVAKLVPINDVPPAFCYFMFRSDEIKGQLNAISYGVAQQNLSPVNMGTLPVSIPPQSLLRMFNDVAEPLVQQSITLKLKNQKLRQARDLLLPRLMNGELAV